MSKRMSAVVALTLLVALAALAAQQLSVQVRETRLRQRPSYLGAGTTVVTYGTRLDVVESQGPWRRVRTAAGQVGWLHESALTERKIQLASGDQDLTAAADSAELALAGKGFSAEVEAAFKQQNRDVDYTWVDRMATWQVSPEEALAFLAAGEVGGAR